ncbi:hypothetical protein V1477_012891 [Vespula maculifrons]|uniref:Uncharacterized protein n=1 Tax=Vespula maculifrons TaxID=7453 RepID=A0ABD2BUE0_VESMC
MFHNQTFLLPTKNIIREKYHGSGYIFTNFRRIYRCALCKLHNHRHKTNNLTNFVMKVKFLFNFEISILKILTCFISSLAPPTIILQNEILSYQRGIFFYNKLKLRINKERLVDMVEITNLTTRKIRHYNRCPLYM